MMDQEEDVPPSKRQRLPQEEQESAITTTTTLSTYTPPSNHDPLRTSSLMAPTIQLTGHRGSVYTLAYNPRGDLLVSGSFDMTCLLWNSAPHNGDNDANENDNDDGDQVARYDNVDILQGHKNAILDVAFSPVDGDFLATASADRTVGWFDVNTGERIKRFIGHDGVVNAVDTPAIPLHDSQTSSNLSGPLASPSMVVSGSDDCTARVWDARASSRRGHVMVMPHEFQVTSVALSRGSGVGGDCTVYTGGIDNCIHAWDARAVSQSALDGRRAKSRPGKKMKKEEEEEDVTYEWGAERRCLMTLKGHTDTITALSTHPHGTHLLSNSMDGTLRTWDIRPFVSNPSKRQCKTFVGGKHNAERGLLNAAWSADGTLVTGGSADRVVHIWDEYSCEELYALPGHTGCVNAVVFHPRENVIASGSSDKSIFVGELSH